MKAFKFMGGLIHNSQSIISNSNRKLFSTVAANTIRITFVDTDGNRVTVPARIGQSLLDVSRQHKIELEGPCNGGGLPTEIVRSENWTETTYGEGANCYLCHVQISSKYNSILPQLKEDEMTGLDETWEDDFKSTSRLACMINLEKKHDGMVVLIPDSPPIDVI